MQSPEASSKRKTFPLTTNTLSWPSNPDLYKDAFHFNKAGSANDGRTGRRRSLGGLSRIPETSSLVNTKPIELRRYLEA